jgi:hypothetical protein
MLKFRSDSCLSKQNKSAYKIKIIEMMIHKIQNQCICIGFFLKPSIFPESNNRLYDKNSESDFFFFLKIYKKDRRDLLPVYQNRDK